MLEQIKGIKFKSDAFENETNFDLFDYKKDKDKNKIKICLIYGNNGSGKTTIARAFNKSCNKVEENIDTSSLIDFNDNNIEKENLEKKVFVFNENYIEKKIKIKEIGLKAIIMFGEQAVLDDKIKEYEEQKKELKSKETRVLDEKAEYIDANSIRSPKHYEEKIINILRNKWAERKRTIINSRTNAPVNEKTIVKIIENRINENETDEQTLKVKYNAYLEDLSLARSGKEKIYDNIPEITNPIENVNYYVKLLEKKIESPMLTEREKTLFKLIENDKKYQIDEMKKTFDNINCKICPYCLQPIESQYRNSLVKSIEKVLSEEQENHDKELRSSIMKKLDINLDKFNDIDKDIIRECLDIVEEINNQILKCNEILENKIKNPFRPISIEVNQFDFKKKINKLKGKLNILEEEKIKYNTKLDDEKKIKKELLKINDELAYIEIIDIYKEYEKALENKNTNEKKIKTLQENISVIENQINILKHQKANVKIAAEQINKNLKFVFFSNKRLYIKLENKQYILYSKGRAVQPKDISVGERNILALCYFFTDIFSGLDERTKFLEERLLVLDDPISSIDNDNRIGIISLLREKLYYMLAGNKNSRCIILSHNSSICYDLSRLCDDIHEDTNEKIVYNFKQINQNRLENINSKKNDYSEYNELLKVIYNYANEEIFNDLTIGNIMRRVLEAFSTFEYGKGISSISNNKDILQHLSKEYREYFENYLYRLTLNGESHFENRIQRFEELNKNNIISKEEKLRTAKCVICFMFLLNKEHVMGHIMFKNNPNKNNEVETNIKKWCAEIENYYTTNKREVSK